jgi:GNAT superfamily N-acetyltransferase
MSIRVDRVVAMLPDGFTDLLSDAQADGHLHMARFAQEFVDTPDMFHAVFGGYIDGRLAGLGAITDEPTRPSQPVWRMRRFYVLREYRGRAVAQTITKALLDVAQNRVATLTVHAGHDGAARFWEAMGFSLSHDTAWTHTLSLTPRIEPPVIRPTPAPP